MFERFCWVLKTENSDLYDLLLNEHEGEHVAVNHSFNELTSSIFQRWGLESLGSDLSSTRVPIVLDSDWRPTHLDMRTRTRLGL